MEFIDKKLWARSLIYKCPRGEPIEDCPLKDLRLMVHEQAYKIIDLMKDQELEDIINHHEKCHEESKK